MGASERAALDESASEVTTDFIPLGTCDDSECMDEAMLVRVSLPAEALLAFGLPMDKDIMLRKSLSRLTSPWEAMEFLWRYGL